MIVLESNGFALAQGPVVVRDATATQALSLDRYDFMRTGQQLAQPVESALVPVNESPTLPALAPSFAPSELVIRQPLPTAEPRVQPLSQ